MSSMDFLLCITFQIKSHMLLCFISSCCCINRLHTFQPLRKKVVAIPVNDPLFLSNNAFCFDYRRKFGVLRTRDFISNYQ